MTTIVSILLSVVSTKLMSLILWCLGMAGVSYGKSHMDWNKFHLGILLCAKQGRDVVMIPQEHRHESSLKCVHSVTLEL